MRGDRVKRNSAFLPIRLQNKKVNEVTLTVHPPGPKSHVSGTGLG